jgi:hypothetical protein
MGVAQLTLSCDRLFITNLCFIRLFSNSSIWRAHRGAGAPECGVFRFARKGLAPNRMLEGIVRPPLRSSISIKRALVPAAEPRLALAAPIGRRISYIKAGCRPVPFQTLITAAGRHAQAHRRSADRRLPVAGFRGTVSAQNRREFGGLESAACGSRPRRAYRPYRSCGRVAEGGGLLNRYRVVKPYRGFESLRLRHPNYLTD